MMPSYNRIEESDRWDIVNYLRSLQGKGTIAADTSHGRPGETGALVPARRAWDRRDRCRSGRRRPLSGGHVPRDGVQRIRWVFAR